MLRLAYVALVFAAIALVFLSGDRSGARPSKVIAGGMIRVPDDWKPNFFAESEQLRQIRDSRTPEERMRRIEELEQMPVDRVSFSGRWLGIHDDVYDGWTETGFDPARSRWPRDVQLLAIASFGFSDIDNGGFSQFFGNSTGSIAPEMVEWCERAGLPKQAQALRDAMALMGTPYPRDQETRRAKVRDERGWLRADVDAALEPIGHRLGCVVCESWFDEAADRWLRETCHIDSLRQ